MNGPRRLILEAHRRSLWQVLSIYLLGSWAAYQIIAEITERMALPDWVPGFAIVLIVVGLPIVLATAFVQEGAPALRRAPRGADTVELTLLPIDADVPAAPAPAATTGRQHLLFTWKKAILGGVTAFLLLGITAGGYMGMRNAGVGPFASLLASGEMDERERILIAEFAPLNGDTVLATAITELFRVDFAQSPTVTVVEPSHVRTVLQRMSRDVRARIDAELAHEIAVRDNIKTYLAGELSQPGGSFVISGRLIATRDNRVLATYRETARDSTQIIAAVDRLSKKLRNKIGESLRTIRAEKLLEAVSTPSLDALRKYTQAVIAIDTDRDNDAGIALLQEALAADSTFAMAWRKLAVAYNNSGAGRAHVVRAASRAYDFRDRLTDTERYHATGFYYQSVKQDFVKAINEYKLLEERDPTWPPNNLGLAYLQIGDWESAAAAFHRSIAVDSGLSVSYTNLVVALTALGEDEEAEAVLAAHERHIGTSPAVLRARASIPAARRDWASAETHVRSMLNESRSNPQSQAIAIGALGLLRRAQGQLAEATRLAEQAADIDYRRGVATARLSAALSGVRMSSYTRGNAERAQAELEAALRAHPLDSIPPLSRPYLTIASLYARLGRADRVTELVAAYERTVPPELRGNDQFSRAVIDGYAAFHQQQYEQAIAAWRRALNATGCAVCLDAEFGLAFEAAAMPDSAIARYEHFVNARAGGGQRLNEDAVNLGPTYERLADLYAGKGDRQNAVRYANLFIVLWANADAELQPRVRAKQDLIRRLGGPG